MAVFMFRAKLRLSFLLIKNYWSINHMLSVKVRVTFN